VGEVKTLDGVSTFTAEAVVLVRTTAKPSAGEMRQYQTVVSEDAAGGPHRGGEFAGDVGIQPPRSGLHV